MNAHHLTADEIRTALACIQAGCECKRKDERRHVHCPAHDDEHPSLSVAEGVDGKVLVKCHAGCRQEDVVEALQQRGLWPTGKRTSRNGQSGSRTRGEGGSHSPPATPATAQHLNGCTLERYADSKRLPTRFLRDLGLSDMSYMGSPTLRIPYRGPDGTEAAVRFRVQLAGDERFRWRSGSKPFLYGLWRLDRARRAGYVVLCEGESDCHTLWYHDIPAIGLPGAGLWKEEWSSCFDGIPEIYVIEEPDKGGEAVRKWLALSRIRDRVRLVRLGDAKDPSGLYLIGPDDFCARFQTALEKAVLWKDIAQAEVEDAMAAVWEQCRDLAQQPDILRRFSRALARSGFIGMKRAAKLVYLIVVSRFLDHPISAAVKGPSSAGKSFLVEKTLAFFPEDAYYALSGMSERLLAYDDEPLSHRILVVYEANGAQGEYASYFLRSLLSEGRLRYKTVEKTPNGMTPRLIEREGPTGFLTTTTRISLHEENETRLLEIPVRDDPKQT
ncbi:MAG TPA: hypothetical protein VKU00_29460, partial [Chthonomonadaceae bacterium]|nr:hypothetical protein [Chthonomonadaceae bacterium]